MFGSAAIGAIWRVVARLFGAARDPSQPARMDAAGSAAIGEQNLAASAAPAVAGYVYRLELACVEIKQAKRPNTFMLHARLASVAKLNVPVGKRPFAARFADRNSPPIPSERIGAKSRRHAPTGNRVLKAKAPPRASATIIPFPAGAARAAAGKKKARRAA